MTDAEIALLIKIRDEASDKLDQLDKKTSGWGKTLGDVGKIAAGFLTADLVQKGVGALTGFIGDSIQEGIKLGESLNAVNKIFGDSSVTILDWGKKNATSFGLSQQAFNQLATPLGAGLKNSGLAMDVVADSTIELTKRAADMASVFNTDVDEAMQSIQAGLRGQGDPLEKYGVGLTAAKVEARALADSGKTLASSLTDQEKMMARMAIIFDETASSAGDFADTSGEAANAARIQAAKMEELQATIGQKLLPVQLLVTKAKLAMVDAIATHVLPAIEALMRVLGPLVQVFGAALTGNLQGAHAAFVKLPEPLYGVAQAAFDLGSAMHKMWREDIQPALVQLMAVAGQVVAFIAAHWPEIQKVIGFAADYVITRVQGMIQVVQSIIEIVSSVVNLVSALFHGDWSRAWQEMKDIASGLIDLVLGIIKAQFGNIPGIVIGFITDTVSGFYTEISKLPSIVEEFVGSIPGAILGLASDALGAARTFGANVYLGIKGEIEDLPYAMLTIGSKIVSGLWDGISSMAGWLTGKVTGFAKSIYGAVTDGLGELWPGSPSIAGIKIATGLADGIDAGAPKVFSAFGAITEDLIDRINDLSDDVRMKFGDLIAEVGKAAGYTVFEDFSIAGANTVAGKALRAAAQAAAQTTTQGPADILRIVSGRSGALGLIDEYEGGSEMALALENARRLGYTLPPGFSQGGYVGRTGTYRLHAGERVLNQRETSGGGGNTYVYNQNAPSYGIQDLRRQIRDWIFEEGEQGTFRGVFMSPS